MAIDEGSPEVPSVIDVKYLFEPGMEHQKVLKVLSRSGVSSILFCLERSPKRFSQLMFETRLNPGILDRHLKALMKLDIVAKVSDCYELTRRGREVVNILHSLLDVL